MSTVKRPITKLRNRPSVAAEQEIYDSAKAHASKNEKRCRGRPLLGENRRAPLTLYDLRQLAQHFNRLTRHLPKTLQADNERHEAKICGAIAELESRPAMPRQPREKVGYAVTRPGGRPAVVHGMDALGKVVGRSPNYVQKKLSQGNGVARLQCEHPETGNPDHIIIERLGIGFASSQKPCQKPKNAVGERNDEAPSNSSDE